MFRGWRTANFLMLICFTFAAPAYCDFGVTAAVLAGTALLSAGFQAYSAYTGGKAQERENTSTDRFNLRMFNKQTRAERKRFEEEMDFSKEQFEFSKEQDRKDRVQDYMWKLSNGLMAQPTVVSNLSRMQRERR